MNHRIVIGVFMLTATEEPGRSWCKFKGRRILLHMILHCDLLSGQCEVFFVSACTAALATGAKSNV